MAGVETFSLAGRAVRLSGSLHAVRLWRVELDRPPEDVARLSDVLDPPERARAASFRYDCDRNRFVVGRAILRLLLAADGNEDPEVLRLQTNAYGKPELAANRRHFNFSRSGGSALLAIGGAPLGIDLERVRPVAEKERIAEQVFGHHERAWMRAVTDPERTARFFQLWTRKEALVKAAGRGLSEDLRRFDTLCDQRTLVEIAAWGDRWQISDLCYPRGHFAALAIHLGEVPGHSSERCD